LRKHSSASKGSSSNNKIDIGVPINAAWVISQTVRGSDIRGETEDKFIVAAKNACFNVIAGTKVILLTSKLGAAASLDIFKVCMPIHGPQQSTLSSS
jgi:hypothetical protein